jgi:NADH-quinone oxidoreductase subunit J
MTLICHAACIVALISALMVITRRNAMHALLYLILMLLALGLVFFTLGAAFLAILQIIVYAGAIMVLFVFVVMMLNLGRPGERQEQRWLGVEVWAVPAILTLALFLLCGYALLVLKGAGLPAGPVSPKQVGLALYREYILAVELASLVLVAGLVGAFHLAPPTRQTESTENQEAGND